MTCKYEMDPVYLELMNARTDYDKMMIKQYNCVSYQQTVSPSLVSMLPPDARASFQPTKMVNPSVSYQLNPTEMSMKNAEAVA